MKTKERAEIGRRLDVLIGALQWLRGELGTNDQTDMRITDLTNKMWSTFTKRGGDVTVERTHLIEDVRALGELLARERQKDAVGPADGAETLADRLISLHKKYPFPGALELAKVRSALVAAIEEAVAGGRGRRLLARDALLQKLGLQTGGQSTERMARKRLTEASKR